MSRLVRRAAVLGLLLVLAAGAPAAAAPSVGAPAAILVESDLGVTVWARNAHQERAIASTTKLMTAYVTLHRTGVGRLLVVAPYAPAPGETVAGLRPGELLSVGDLLAAMLLPSGGDAAHTLAVDLAGSTDRFVGWMNQAAAGLHMRQTHYSTPVGLDTPGNYSTAADLAVLAGALMTDPFFAHTVAQPQIVLADGRTMVNRNDLVGSQPFVVGIKTGSTAAAGYCLVGAGRRDGATVISVVLGDPSEQARDLDSLALLRYGLSLYHAVEPVHRGRVYARVPVYGRPREHLALVAARSLTLVLRRGVRLIVYDRDLAALARGPLPSHTVLGRLAVKLHGRLVALVALVSRSPLAPPPAAGGP